MGWGVEMSCLFTGWALEITRSCDGDDLYVCSCLYPLQKAFWQQGHKLFVERRYQLCITQGWNRI